MKLKIGRKQVHFNNKNNPLGVKQSPFLMKHTYTVTSSGGNKSKGLRH